MHRPILAFDTEDDSQGNVKLLNVYDGKEHRTFYDPEAMRKFFGTLKVKCLVWSVNLEYDMMNLFKDDLDSFPGQIWFGKSRLVSFIFKKHLFYDTLNHWKISVEEMAKVVGRKKVALDVDDILKLTDRCRSDCEITYLFVKEMLTRYEFIEARVKSTLPSTSLKLFSERFSRFKFKDTDTKDTDFLKRSYCGGRTECFFIGKMQAKKERIYYVDINSMYPSVMLEAYPMPYTYEKIPDLGCHGATEAEVESELDVPILPVRSNGKLVFPNGVFRGVWSNVELKYALSKGVHLRKLIGGFHYPFECFPFKDFINEMYRLRLESKDDLMRQTYKLLMNSLYGKFGQGRERKKVIRFDKYCANPEKFSPQMMKGAYTFADKLMIYQEIEDKYPRNTIMIWASYVTSYARIKLHNLMMDIKDQGGTLLYCDTDSIMYKGSRDMVDESKDLGAFKIEHELSGVNIRLPKFYRAWREDGEIIVERVKGVPRRVQKEFFEKGHVTYDKPNKFFESMRRNLEMNKWQPVTRTLNSRYDKGLVMADGYVKPLNFSLTDLTD